MAPLLSLRVTPPPACGAGGSSGPCIARGARDTLYALDALWAHGPDLPDPRGAGRSHRALNALRTRGAGRSRDARARGSCCSGDTSGTCGSGRAGCARGSCRADGARRTCGPRGACRSRDTSTHARRTMRELARDAIKTQQLVAGGRIGRQGRNQYLAATLHPQPLGAHGVLDHEIAIGWQGDGDIGRE